MRISPRIRVWATACCRGPKAILKGEPIDFAAIVKRGEPGRALAIELASLDGKATLKFDLAKQDVGNVWTVERNSGSLGNGFEKGFTYRIVGGGTWSTEQRIDLLERPVIVSTQVSVHYPAYMSIPEARSYKPQELDVSGPEAGAVEVEVEAEGSVAKQEIQIIEQRIKKEPIAGRAPRIWFDGKLPEGAKPDAGWQWLPSVLGKSQVHTQPAVPGAYGHAFADATTPFAVKMGERLTAEVFVDPQYPPEAIMLQWQDENGSWEHRAFWGADKIPFGQPGTASRFSMGPIPSEWLGKWVQLEVPVTAVGLEGKSLRGMAFTLFGGKCSWASKAGAGLPSTQDVTESVVIGTHPMQRIEQSNRFKGWFPLKSAGFYRVELSNELGYANKAMKEGRFEATPDRAPEIVLEKPGVDITLSVAEKIPLQALVRDDYGLNEVWLAVQREGELRFTRTLRIKGYPTPNPAKVDTLIAQLDVEAMNLKLGESFRYRLEVNDRRPTGEFVASKDYFVRLANDPNAADKQLTEFLKAQDPFREKLAALIAQQQKVAEKLDATAKKYEAVEEKIKQSQIADSLKNDPKMTPMAKAEPTKQPLTAEQIGRMNPDDLKKLAELRKELAEIATEEAKNDLTVKQLAAELNNLADKAEKTPLVSKDIADAFKDTQALFAEKAVSPIGDLLEQIKKGANPQDAVADVKNLDQKAERVQQNLEAIKRQMEALADAQKKMKQDPNAALQALKNAQSREQANMSAAELAELKDFLKGLREQLKEMKNLQGDLAKNTEKAPAAELPMIEGKQDVIEKQSDTKIDQAKNVLDKKRLERLKKNLNLPDAPYTPEGKEQLTPPTEEDTAEAKKPMNADGKDPMGDKKPMADGDKPEDEDANLQPALSGEKLKQDPRFDKKKRPSPKKPKDPNAKPDPNAQRQDLQDRQNDNQQALDNADKALESDQNAVDKLIGELEAMAKNAGKPSQPQEPKSGQGGDDPMSQDADVAKAMQDLKDLMNSQKMANAKQMAQRAKQAGKGSQSAQPPSPTPPMPGEAAKGNLDGKRPGEITEADLSKIDLQTRAILMQLPPAVREELLQGMKDEGPEGYRRFVADYFKRLSEMQPKK